MTDEYGFMDIEYISDLRGGARGAAAAAVVPTSGGFYDIVASLADLPMLDDIKHPTGALVYVQNEHAFYLRGDGIAAHDMTDWIKWHEEPSPPSFRHTWEWVPDAGVRGGHEQWVDGRLRLGVVADIAHLSDRTVMPLSNMEVGKLVWVTSESRLYELKASTSTLTNTAADWEPFISGVTYVGTVANLPVKAQSGEMFIIRQEIGGDEYYRLVAYDPTMRPVATTPIPLISQIGPVITALGTLGPMMAAATMDAANAGGYWQLGGGGGPWTFGIQIPGTPPALDGQIANVGTRVINLGDRRLGFGGWGLGTIADHEWVPPAVTSSGGWRYLNRKAWLKPLRLTPNVMEGRLGDFEATVEKDHSELWINDGTNWRLLFGEDAIKTWIAALSLFEGTVEEVGGANPGAVDLAGLPALSLDKVGHYYTWVGSPNFNVIAASPGIGPDLDGAVLNPGDWLQQANRGTVLVPDLHWVQVGGDLLAKSRGDRLYGLTLWADGGWEAGSLVIHGTHIYRATAPIIAGDKEPGLAAGGSVTGKAAAQGGVTSAHMFDGVQAGNPVDALNAGTWWTNTSPADLTASSGPLAGMVMHPGDAVIDLGDPTLGHGGWAIIPAPFPGGIPTFGAAANKWSELTVGQGGIMWVPTDGDLPATAPPSQVYLVLKSAIGHAKASLFIYDKGEAKWVLLGGGGGGVPLELSSASGYIDTMTFEYDSKSEMPPNPVYRGDVAFDTYGNYISHVCHDGRTWAKQPHPLHFMNGTIAARLVGGQHWYLCDGSSVTGEFTQQTVVTLDMSDRMLAGSGRTVYGTVGNTGGTGFHHHEVISPQLHTGVNTEGPDHRNADWAASSTHVHRTDVMGHLPPYITIDWYVFVI